MDLCRRTVVYTGLLKTVSLLKEIGKSARLMLLVNCWRGWNSFRWITSEVLIEQLKTRQSASHNTRLKFEVIITWLEGCPGTLEYAYRNSHFNKCGNTSCRRGTNRCDNTSHARRHLGNWGSMLHRQPCVLGQCLGYRWERKYDRHGEYHFFMCSTQCQILHSIYLAPVRRISLWALIPRALELFTRQARQLWKPQPVDT